MLLTSLIGEFDNNGKFIEIFAGVTGVRSFDPDKLSGAYYITIDNRDNVYVSDTTENRIQVWNKEGKIIDLIGPDYLKGEYTAASSNDIGKFNIPHKIFFDRKTNKLWVADLYNDRIQIFDGETRKISSIIELGGNRPKILQPLGNGKFLTGSALSKVGIFSEWI